MDIDELQDWIGRGVTPQGGAGASAPQRVEHDRRVNAFWTVMAGRRGLSPLALTRDESWVVRTCLLVDLMLESSPQPDRRIVVVGVSDQDRTLLQGLRRIEFVEPGEATMNACAAVVFAHASNEVQARLRRHVPRSVVIQAPDSERKLVIVS